MILEISPCCPVDHLSHPLAPVLVVCRLGTYSPEKLQPELAANNQVFSTVHYLVRDSLHVLASALFEGFVHLLLVVATTHQALSGMLQCLRTKNWRQNSK